MNKTKRKLQLAAGIIAAASGGLMALILFINGIITLSTISRWYPGFFTISIFTFFFPFGVSLTTMILGIFFCTSPIKNNYICDKRKNTIALIVLGSVGIPSSSFSLILPFINALSINSPFLGFISAFLPSITLYSCIAIIVLSAISLNQKHPQNNRPIAPNPNYNFGQNYNQSGNYFYPQHGGAANFNNCGQNYSNQYGQNYSNQYGQNPSQCNQNPQQCNQFHQNPHHCNQNPQYPDNQFQQNYPYQQGQFVSQYHSNLYNWCKDNQAQGDGQNQCGSANQNTGQNPNCASAPQDKSCPDPNKDTQAKE